MLVVMRQLCLSMLLVTGAALAQAPGDTGPAACNVDSDAFETNERGEIVPAPASPEDCAAAADIVEKFLSTNPEDFRRVVQLEPIPGNVRVYVGRMAPFGGPWRGSVGVSGGDLPGQRHIATFISDRIVVVVSETSDFAGPVLNVTVIDLETRQACHYPRWPETEDPRRLSAEELQDVLDSGLAGDQPTPACHLQTTPLEDDPLGTR